MRFGRLSANLVGYSLLVFAALISAAGAQQGAPTIPLCNGTPCFTAANPGAVSGTVITQSSTGVFTDRSGSIAVGGTSQVLASSNSSRKQLLIENPCSATGQGIGSAENLFINFTSAASISDGKSIELQPCGSFDTAGAPPTTEAVTVNAATTAHQFTAKEM